MGDIAKIENKTSLLAKFASRYDVEPQKMLATLKATCFRLPSGEVSNEQMIALLAVADQYGLNPFLKEIYAFPDKGGIVPVVGVDGWARMMNDHLQFDGIEFVYSDKIIESPEHQPVPEWCECVIYRKDRRHPTRVREWFNEVYRKPIVKSDGKVIAGPWQTHTKRFFRHKTMIQGNRLAFGFTGIYEPDEAERIRESRVIDITPTRDDVTDLNTELGLLTDGTDERPAEE